MIKRRNKMPLHIDYRPKTLKDVMGNKATVASIESILSRSKDYPHAWLFTGPSGCGKTTLARIVADRLGISSMDLQEINNANFRGIESAREIQEQMRNRPLGGKYRAWILDECHQATKEFWSAMLKPLEDTPEHVFFFLCTTDPQKLLKTIVNRCEAARFVVESLSDIQVASLLQSVIKTEGASVPDEVVKQISVDCLGSARAALGMLDKIIDMEPDSMLEAAKKAAAEQSETIDLCRALLNKSSWIKVAPILRGLEAEPEQIRQAVLGYMNAVLSKEDNFRAWTVMDALREPLHYNGKAGLTMACYEAVNAK